MKLARWLVPAVSLLLVLLFTWWDLSRADAGPGPLHSAHAAVASLQGGANCAGCHRDGAVSASACVECHAAIGEQGVAQVGLHATLAQSQCAMCHPEHHGDTAPLVPPHAFQRVGIEDVEKYDHRHVDFALTGSHLQVSCERCHEHANDLQPPAGGRFLGLSQQCTACHEDVHAAAFGKNCQSCHGQSQPFAAVPGFSHARFALDGAHSKVACAACHESGSGRDVAIEEQEELSTRTCSGCHANVHESNGGVLAKSLLFPKGDDCARCHQVDAWDSARPTLEEHAQLGFALRGLHAKAECATCHGDSQHKPLWQGEAPELPVCAACHESPHAAGIVAAAVEQLAAASPFASRLGCAGCHRDADQDFAGGTISAEQHLATGFALATPHADLACAKCHDGAGREQRFPGRTASDCRTCHQDVHQGQFQVAGQVQQCTECHQAERFLPHRFGASAHAATFALTGAHDAVACSACHDQVVAGVRRFVGTSRTCDGCHQDVHHGAFDLRNRPTTIDGREGCARCHSTESFRPVTTAFDHQLWTGFALVGAHQPVACAQCHDGAATTGVAKVAGTQCASCHQDPHLGQFAVAGRSDCQRCHAVTQWSEPVFDHQRHSKFTLDDVHQDLQCSKCHVGYAVGGREVIRYKPLGTRCGDCHQFGAGAGKGTGIGSGTGQGMIQRYGGR